MTAIRSNACRRWPKTFRSGIVAPPRNHSQTSRSLSDSQPRHIGILAYPGVALLDAVGPLEVFAAANIVLAERSPRGAKAYQVEIWSERVGAIDGSCGVSLNATRSIAAAAPFELDTLIVAGSPGTGNLVSKPCVDWLREATGGIRRVGGICTGVFLLAEAGLLDAAP
jgi:transcriptional regulator GlxA family with amidase domain